jgi:hypothetical protein
MALFGVFWDAARLYFILWRHSLPAAALAQAAVWLAGLGWGDLDSGALAVPAAILTLVLLFAAPLLVQGMLIELVRSVHEGRRAAEIRELAAHALKRFPALLGGSLLYWFGIIFGLVLLIVPGLIAFARWSLFAPLVVLERRSPAEAITRSSELVTGKTFQVLLIVGAVTALDSGSRSTSWTELIPTSPTTSHSCS